jgi:hypothetical protein
MSCQGLFTCKTASWVKSHLGVHVVALLLHDVARQAIKKPSQLEAFLKICEAEPLRTDERLWNLFTPVSKS